MTLSGLTAGENVITLNLSDPNGAATRSYKVTLTRDAQSPGSPAQPSNAVVAWRATDRDDVGGEDARDLLFCAIRDENAKGVMSAIEAGVNINDAPRENKSICSHACRR